MGDCSVGQMASYSYTIYRVLQQGNNLDHNIRCRYRQTLVLSSFFKLRQFFERFFRVSVVFFFFLVKILHLLLIYC